MAPSTWPTLAELEAQLGVDPDSLPDERVAILERALAAAIEQVEIDSSGETGFEPSASLAEAALLLAVRVTKAPDAPFGVAAVFDTGGLYKATNDPDYRRLLKGSRSNFGVA